MKSTILIGSLAATLALGVGAADVEAQGNGRGRTQERRGAEQAGPVEQWLGADRDRQSPRGNGSGKVPPGWCLGVGNPHNTPANCGSRSVTRDRAPNDRYPVYDRYPVRDAAYERAHADFHRDLELRYSRLATQRPTDLQYQLQLRLRKEAEHDAWHRRIGISH